MTCRLRLFNNGESSVLIRASLACVSPGCPALGRPPFNAIDPRTKLCLISPITQATCWSFTSPYADAR
jgi:hypothetical protein